MKMCQWTTKGLLVSTGTYTYTAKASPINALCYGYVKKFNGQYQTDGTVKKWL